MFLHGCDAAPAAQGTGEDRTSTSGQSKAPRCSLLDPAEVVVDYEPTERVGANADPFPDLVDAEGKPLRFDLLGGYRRAIEGVNAVAVTPAQVDLRLTSTSLVGYYELDNLRVPVLEHQLPAWQRLIDTVLAGRKSPGWVSFDDLRPPAPSQRSVTETTEYVTTRGQAPEFHDLRASSAPADCAAELLDGTPRTEQQRHTLVRRWYDTTLARLVHATFEQFAEQVEIAVRELQTRRLNPEQRPVRADRPIKLLPNVPERSLAAPKRQALDVGRMLLDPELRAVLDHDTAPVDWASLPSERTYAYWTLNLREPNRGQGRIFVNPLLRTSTSVVSDEMLAYLIWHELLHDVLRGHAHDATFRQLEHSWPDATHLRTAST